MRLWLLFGHLRSCFNSLGHPDRLAAMAPGFCWRCYVRLVLRLITQKWYRPNLRKKILSNFVQCSMISKICFFRPYLNNI